MEEAIHQNKEQFDRVCQQFKRLLVKKQRLKAELPVQIIEGVLVGNYAHATDASIIQDNAIGLVVSCLKVDDKSKIVGVEYRQLLIRDKPEEAISVHFGSIQAIITQYLRQHPQKKCLIHCFSGKSRSVSLLIAYLIGSRRISYQEAYDLVKSKYDIAAPNSGFVEQLKNYAGQCKHIESTNLLEIGQAQHQHIVRERKSESVIEEINNENQTQLIELKAQGIQWKQNADKVSEEQPQQEKPEFTKTEGSAGEANKLIEDQVQTSTIAKQDQVPLAVDQKQNNKKQQDEQKEPQAKQQQGKVSEGQAKKKKKKKKR